MDQYEFSGYIGCFKQPIHQPERNVPTMYILSDPLRYELDLVLLTPGTFLHAYQYITRFHAQNVRLFVPSLRYDFISDVYNLYMIGKDKMPIQWVFPEKTDYYSFSLGQMIEEDYTNQHDTRCSIRYQKNENVDDVYDIIISDSEGCHYFSQYLTKEKAIELFENPDIYDIHIPYSSTLYGGLTYCEVLLENVKYRTKFVPHSFSSESEYYIHLRDRKLQRGKVATL